MLMGPEAHVHYWQIYVQALDGEEWPDLPGSDEAFACQSNGICGAAAPGALFLHTGLHSGKVGFAVELHDSRPPVDDGWEEIVEASFSHAPASQVMLVTWGGEDSWPLDLAEAHYRVRYCATGMDAAYEADTRVDDEPQIDRYLLQFWPDPGAPAPDLVVKQTSEIAENWHGHARSLPPPPTPEERAAQAAAEERARAEQERAAQEALELDLWGGLRPSERLRNLNGAATALARLDQDLVGALDAADAETQRRVARWAAHRACAEAGLTDVRPVADALTALDRGEQPGRPVGTANRSGSPAHEGHLAPWHCRLLPAVTGLRRAARRRQGRSARRGDRRAVAGSEHVRPGAVSHPAG
jgi:hypothetical protein